MSGQNGYNMTTLIKRLEAATSRLEDLANFAESANPGAAAAPAPVAAAAAVPAPVNAAVLEKDGVLSNGSDAISPKSSIATVGSVPFKASATEPSPLSAEFLALDASLEKLQKMSSTIDPIVNEQFTLFVEAAAKVKSVITVSSKSQKADPASPEFAELISPVSALIGKIYEAREANRTSQFSNHLATLAEGAPVFGWVTSPLPASYVQDFKESAQFYANRVLKDFREVPVHTEWVKAFLAFFDSLKTVITKDFRTGLNWDPKGKPLKENLSQLDAAAPAATSAAAPPPPPGSAGGPPPPPPPPSIEQLSKGTEPAPDASAGGSMSAVFSDLSKGLDVTSGLKHIDRKAIKEANKSLPPKPGPKPALKAKAASTSTPTAPTAKPARAELVDNRWVIENFVDNPDIKIEVEIHQTVYIDNCERSTIQIKGKANAVTINKTKRVGVLVDTLVSGVEIVRSSDFGLQITGTLHSLAIDQSHSGQIYLSKEALDVDIYTSQTSTINVSIPIGEDGDFREVPLPEQIIHKVSSDGKSVSSNAVTANDK